MAIDPKSQRDADLNRDPITGEPGAHPIGTGLGAASGAAAGAVIGTAAGPIGSAAGAVIGAIAGGVAGGLAGSEIAELVNPTEEEAYWRTEYTNRPYVEAGSKYETYQPAYRYGYDSRIKTPNKEWTEVESDLSTKWDNARGASQMEWNSARDAVRDSYERAGQTYRNRLGSSHGNMNQSSGNAQNQPRKTGGSGTSGSGF